MRLANMWTRRLLLIAVFLVNALAISGCIGQKEELISGRFTFGDTDLSIELPANWSSTRIPGSQYPIVFTDIDYGIKPNIRLEFFSPGAEVAQARIDYFQQLLYQYPDYRVLDEQPFSVDNNSLAGTKVLARRVNHDGIPLIQISYILAGQGRSVIISSTCAEPGLGRYEEIFDRIIGTAALGR